MNGIKPFPVGSAYLRSVPPSEQPVRADTTGDVLSWGSEVEMPPPGETVPIPRAPPLINIQAPTDSQATKSRRAVTPGGQSEGQRTPQKSHTRSSHERRTTVPNTVGPDPRDRELPSPPSGSDHSVVPTRVPKSAAGRGDAQRALTPTRGSPSQGDQASQSIYKSAIEEPLGLPLSPHRNETPGNDPNSPKIHKPAPWDLITQRLYSWALVWEEHTFIRALEHISLGHQVSKLMRYDCSIKYCVGRRVPIDSLCHDDVQAVSLSGALVVQ